MAGTPQFSRLFGPLVPTMTSLQSIVSPLVDSLSLLVLECVGGSLKDVTTHCMNLASNTQALVDQAQKVAMSTDDPEVVNEIINSINIIADHIGHLVESFTTLVGNRTDPSLVKAFSAAAQNVADSINNLVNVTDETSQKRLIGLVRYVNLLEPLQRPSSFLLNLYCRILSLITPFVHHSSLLLLCVAIICLILSKISLCTHHKGEATRFFSRSPIC